MSETTRVVIPYESMDPLAIGATDDESKKHRDTLEVDIRTANLITVVQPDEPAPVGDPTEAARAALAEPTSGPAFAALLAGKQSVAVVIDNQFRPTPSSKLLPAVFDAIEAAGVTDVRVCCANGKVFPMSESDTEQKVGRDNLARMERNGWSFTQNDPQNAGAYTYVGVSSGGTPVWLLNEVASAALRITIGQAQANHWGAGGGGKLILPGVVSDETVESNHCAFVTSPQTHYGAYCGPMRADIDEVASMCGLDCTMNVLLDTHGRVIDVLFGSHPEAHREAIRRHAPPTRVEEEVVGGREHTADRDVRLAVLGDERLVRVDVVEAADRLAVRLGMRAEDDVDHAAVRVEENVHRAFQAAHRGDLVDVGPHRAAVGAVVRLRRGHECAVVRLDRLVGDHAREDQLAAAARAPVVRLCLADRDPECGGRDLVQQPDRRAAR